LFIWLLKRSLAVPAFLFEVVQAVSYLDLTRASVFALSSILACPPQHEAAGSEGLPIQRSQALLSV